MVRPGGERDGRTHLVDSFAPGVLLTDVDVVGIPNYYLFPIAHTEPWNAPAL